MLHPGVHGAQLGGLGCCGVGECEQGVRHAASLLGCPLVRADDDVGAVHGAGLGVNRAAQPCGEVFDQVEVGPGVEAVFFTEEGAVLRDAPGRAGVLSGVLFRVMVTVPSFLLDEAGCVCARC